MDKLIDDNSHNYHKIYIDYYNSSNLLLSALDNWIIVNLHYGGRSSGGFWPVTTSIFSAFKGIYRNKHRVM